MEKVQGHLLNGSIKPKMWLMKADDGTTAFKASANINDIRLSCDCTCPDCKATYNAYLVEKSMCKLLQERVDENEIESALMIEQVKSMETQYTLSIQELEASIRLKQQQVESIQGQLEMERKLRMEDIYKLEFEKEDNSKQAAEIRSLRAELKEALQNFPNLELENKVLKYRCESNSDTINKMDAELQQYSYELTKLEDTNTRLRLKLSDSDTQINNSRIKSIAMNQAGGTNNLLIQRPNQSANSVSSDRFVMKPPPSKATNFAVRPF